ncbi:hypothetical protein [Armatimonas sp.]|uniref:hypothetical protein n=1 Tax=Armatimonas sp. TaxID=1872638 RepID=UPI00375365CD
MSRIFLLTLLGALALPSMAQTMKPTQRFSVGAGSFYPGGSDNNRHSNTSFTYWPGFHGGTFTRLVSVYLDTNRRKTVTGTGTTAVTKAMATQGLGLSFKANILPFTCPGIYQIVGIGFYQRRVSEGTAHTTGYSPGGKFGVGYQQGSLFVEADYTVVGHIKNNDPSGLGLRVGVRF